MHSKGWEFSCPFNFIGGLPESLTPGLVVGQLLIGRLAVGRQRAGAGRPVGRVAKPGRVRRYVEYEYVILRDIMLHYTISLSLYIYI